MEHEDEILSKPNRRRRLKPKKHLVVVGPRPPTGVHRADRKRRNKKRNLAIKKALK
jgi:hypothetical protein